MSKPTELDTKPENKVSLESLLAPHKRPVHYQKPQDLKLYEFPKHIKLKSGVIPATKVKRISKWSDVVVTPQMET